MGGVPGPVPSGRGLRPGGRIHGLESQSCQEGFQKKFKVKRVGTSRKGKQFNPGSKGSLHQLWSPSAAGRGAWANGGRGGAKRMQEQRPLAWPFPVPCPSVHIPNISRGTRLTPHASLPGPSTGHRAGLTPALSLVHQGAPPWAQEGPGSPLYLVQIWPCTKQGASDVCSRASGTL